MLKTDVINTLAKRLGFQSYLEICTPSTGGTYSLIDDAQLVNRQRLMYRRYEGYDDGLDCVYQTTGQTSHELVRAIFHARAGVPGYDVVFVDPFHTYEASMIDLLGAYSLVRPGGAIVVHDCCPADPAIAGSEPLSPGSSWCGVTYQAFVDFTLPRFQAHCYTVDCDFGCGVIFKPEGGSAAEDMRQLEWFLLRHNEDSRYKYFWNNRKTLARLIDADQFLANGAPLATPDVAYTADAAEALTTLATVGS